MMTEINVTENEDKVGGLAMINEITVAEDEGQVGIQAMSVQTSAEQSDHTASSSIPNKRIINSHAVNCSTKLSQDMPRTQRSEDGNSHDSPPAMQIAPEGNSASTIESNDKSSISPIFDSGKETCRISEQQCQNFQIDENVFPNTLQHLDNLKNSGISESVVQNIPSVSQSSKGNWEHSESDKSLDKNKIYQRFLFNTRQQNIGETFETFAASLNILSTSCHYDADEELIRSLIRDRFIAGLRERSTQLEMLKSLRGERICEDNVERSFISNDYDISLEKAIELASMLEKSIEGTKAIKTEEYTVSLNETQRNICAEEVKTRKIESANRITGSTLRVDEMIQISSNSNGILAEYSSGSNNKPLIDREILEGPDKGEIADKKQSSLGKIKKSTSTKRFNDTKKEAPVHNCSHCVQSFTNKKILKKHLRQFHAREESANCDDCGKVFADKTKLQKHSAIHKGNGVICQLCLNCYKSQACLKAHVRGKHEKDGEKVCLICFQIMADENELKEHTTEQHNDGGMMCSICNKQLRMDESLRTHIKKKHSEDGKTICPYCGKMFALIEQHIAKDHSTDEWKKCDQCDFTGSKHMIQCHMYYYHPKGPELICDTCGYRTPHNSVLKQHIRMVHQKIKPYSCGKCNRSFFSESRLRDHDIVFHRNQMFACEICHKSYKIRRQLQVHIRSVHQGIWVHCPQCNLKFAENHDLKRHKKHVHDRNYTFNCDQCGRGFPFSTRLKEHIQKHHNLVM